MNEITSTVISTDDKVIKTTKELIALTYEELVMIMHGRKKVLLLLSSAFEEGKKHLWVLRYLVTYSKSRS